MNNRPERTHPEYAWHAYKKSVLTHTIAYLQRNFLGTDTTEPTATLVCEDVFSVDAKVPIEVVSSLIDELHVMEQDDEHEMKKFDFRRPNDKQQQRKPEAEETGSKAKKKGRKSATKRSRKGSKK